MVSFTGSTRAGKRVAEAGGADPQAGRLELGGKSANVLLDDLDDEGVREGRARRRRQVLPQLGPDLHGLTRMLVPATGSPTPSASPPTRWRPSTSQRTRSPTAPGSGPLSSQAQVERVTGYIQKGIDEGAKLVTGGPERPEGFEQGYYVKPTVFSEVPNDMTIAQEEIFGPVLSIIAYDDEDEAARIANDSLYGLSGGVGPPTPSGRKAVARRIRTGQIEVNGGAFNPNAPFGGYKNSGYGREYGTYGFEEFLEIKAMQL